MRIVAVSFVTAAVVAVGMCPPAMAQWKPTKNVEIISASAAGGGPDGTARIVQRVLSEKKLIPVSSVVVNRPGGQQTVAMNYLAQRPRDGHYIAVASTPLLSNHIIGASTQHYRDFTPLQLLFSEYLVLSVRPDSPIKTIGDLIERMKKDPASLSYAVGTSVGGINHLAAAVGLAAAGVDITKMKVVIFNSSSDAMTAVLGGHLDVSATYVNFAGPMAEAGKMRPLVVTSEGRQPGALAGVPSWKELGFDAVVQNWRMLMGPKDMPADQQAYWRKVLAQLVEMPEFKEDLANNGQQLTTGVALQPFLADQERQFTVVLKAIGLAK
jgi:putative tricarboxylic transport membrane protein